MNKVLLIICLILAGEAKSSDTVAEFYENKTTLFEEYFLEFAACSVTMIYPVIEDYSLTNDKIDYVNARNGADSIVDITILKCIRLLEEEFSESEILTSAIREVINSPEYRATLIRTIRETEPRFD